MEPNQIVRSFLEVDMSDLKLPTIGVFYSPSDMPGKYVARLFEREFPTDIIIVGETLEEIRKGIPFPFKRIERFTEDNAAVVEVWI